MVSVAVAQEFACAIAGSASIVSVKPTTASTPGEESA